jgi:hypothetical protein
MSFIEQDSRNSNPYSASDATESANYFAFFDKPTPENLASNHGGVLSLQQQKALETMIANQRSTIAVVGGMLILAAFFMGFLFWKIDASDGAVSFNAQLINAAVLLLIIGLFAGLFFGEWFVFFAENDLENRVVESATGRIEWNGRRYQMRTDTRLLRSLRSAVALPPPGDYRFYYLPHMGLVVMAEQLPAAHRAGPASILYQALSNANRFSADDLSQNQKGFLSQVQEHHLLSTMALYALIFIISAALFVSMTSRILQGVGTTMFVMLLIIGILLGAQFGWSSLRILLDVWRGEVRHIDGRVSRRTRRSRYHTTFFYVMDRYNFEVSAAAYEAIVEGLDYRIFFVPFSERLVSIEPLQILKEANNDLPDHTA